MTPKRKSGKARTPGAVVTLEHIPNVGPALATDLWRIGVRLPGELPGRDPYALYDALCRRTGVRQDPCVLDVFISAVRFMEGAPSKPWWHYTAERKASAARADAETRNSGRKGRRRRVHQRMV